MSITRRTFLICVVRIFDISYRLFHSFRHTEPNVFVVQTDLSLPPQLLSETLLI